MKPIYSTGDKVYLTEEDDFVDYEIVEISAVDENESHKPNEKYKYKIRPVKGDKTLVKSESEIFPITFAWWLSLNGPGIVIFRIARL